jgi:CDP-diacylglycerol--glycerol-3-phosphate 3-phosphatidyltransferase
MGKHKTAWQIITVIFFLSVLSIREFRQLGPLPVSWYWSDFTGYAGVLLIACTLGFTIYSGCGYLWKNRALLRTS